LTDGSNKGEKCARGVSW